MPVLFDKKWWIARVSGSEKGRGPEKTSLHGEVDEPVDPYSSGIIQL